MSGQLRTLKNRIRSVGNTKQITRAMEMVAAAKLKRYQNMMVQGAPYAEGLEALLGRVSQTGSFTDHPLMEKREEKKTALLVMTSDTGLCGSYNNDLIQKALAFLKENETEPLLIGIGKYGVHALERAGYKFTKTFVDIKTSEIEEVIGALKDLLASLFSDKEVDAIYAVYSHFLSSTKSEMVSEKILPFEMKEAEQESASNESYIMEPDPKFLFQKLVPAVFASKTRRVFIESFVSEQIARMNAMHMATENAKDLIDSLVLMRNKARQASITKELIKIVSGSQALKK